MNAVSVCTTLRPVLWSRLRLLLLICALGMATLLPSSPASAQATAPTHGFAYSDPYGEEEFVDSDPLLIPFLLGMIGMGLLVFAVCMGIGLAVLGILAALIGMGLLATSTLTSLATRSAKAGVRALFLQLGALGGVLLGVSITWIAQAFFEVNFTHDHVYLYAGGAGFVGGLLVALLFNFSWERLLQILIHQVQKLRLGLRQRVSPSNGTPLP